MTKSPAQHEDEERRHRAARHRGAFCTRPNSPRASPETRLGTRARIWHACSCSRAATAQGMTRIPQHPALLSTTGGHRAPPTAEPAPGANPSTRTPKPPSPALPSGVVVFLQMPPSKIKAQTSYYLGIFSPAITQRGSPPRLPPSRQRRSFHPPENPPRKINGKFSGPWKKRQGKP